MTIADDILDGLFHGCAFAAFVEQAVLTQGPPDPEATRILAYRYYEEELAIKNRRRSRALAGHFSCVPIHAEANDLNSKEIEEAMSIFDKDAERR